MKKGTILIYHRVIDLEIDPFHLMVHPKRFEDQIRYLRNKFNLIPLQELVKKISKGESVRNCIVITFDDGYADNLYSAKPILEKYQVPATFFAVVGMIGSKREFWWDELERIFLIERKSFKRLERNKQKRESDILKKNNSSDNYFEMHRLLKYLPNKKREKILDSMFDRLGLNRNAGRETHRILKREELQELARGELFEIGSHSITHMALTALPEERRWLEIKNSKALLEQYIDSKIRSFSYPFGLNRDIDENCIQIVKKSGYVCGTSNIQGEIDNNVDLYLLPRRIVGNWELSEFKKKLDKF